MSTAEIIWNLIGAAAGLYIGFHFKRRVVEFDRQRLYVSAVASLVASLVGFFVFADSVYDLAQHFNLTTTP